MAIFKGCCVLEQREFLDLPGYSIQALKRPHSATEARFLERACGGRGERVLPRTQLTAGQVGARGRRQCPHGLQEGHLRLEAGRASPGICTPAPLTAWLTCCPEQAVPGGTIQGSGDPVFP